MFNKIGLPLLAVCMLGFALFHIVKAQQTAPKMEPLVRALETEAHETVVALEHVHRDIGDAVRY